MSGVDAGAVPAIAGRWTVVSIRAASGTASYEVTRSTWPHPVTVEFRPERGGRRLPGLRRVHGSFAGVTGCNSTLGSYRHVRDRLRPQGTVATTLVWCDGEPDVHQVLRSMRRVAPAEDGGLLLLDGDRRVLAQLRRPG